MDGWMGGWVDGWMDNEWMIDGLSKDSGWMIDR